MPLCPVHLWGLLASRYCGRNMKLITRQYLVLILSLGGAPLSWRNRKVNLLFLVQFENRAFRNLSTARPGDLSSPLCFHELAQQFPLLPEPAYTWISFLPLTHWHLTSCFWNFKLSLLATSCVLDTGKEGYPTLPSRMNQSSSPPSCMGSLTPLTPSHILLPVTLDTIQDFRKWLIFASHVLFSTCVNW
jgi:hypothetical protein